MRSSHSAGRVSAAFDDTNLVSHGGLVPLMRLAERVGLTDLGDTLTLGGSTGSNAGAKITSIVAGMAAGADSIDDLDVLRHGGLPRLFTGIRAPSTLGSFLRHFGIGHVGQLEKLARVLLGRLRESTGLLPDAADLAFLDVDSKITQVYGRRKEGAKFGYTRVRGLDFLAATVSTPAGAPVITGTRLRSGNAGSRRAATSFVKANIAAARTSCGASGDLLVRLDSGFYVAAVLNAIVDAGAWFSVTAQQRGPVRRAIASIDEHEWVPIDHGKPLRDSETGELLTGAEVAETPLTVFTNPTEHRGLTLTARLIVRRTPIPADAQDTLFTAWRYQAIFTNSPFDPVTVETRHRGRAGAIEQVFADLNGSALAHLPSGRFAANAAWLSLAAITHNLLRAAGALTGPFYAKARTATIRRRLIGVAARIARSGRRTALHLPAHWPWADPFTALFTAAHAPPAH
ncbi:IS1380 family transposase [Rhodococcus sp. NPDC058505]|uniref:IS1380 family transposase n=1 Tax=unclassified Rhodococcus (in: high G+C Gram-positive bacteria) TaxID=192944 RepID=UPI003646B690